MRRVNQGAALIFLVGSLLVMMEAHNLEYYTKLGPGSGFFPMWIGSVLALLSVVWLVQESYQPAEPMPDGFVPDRGGALRMVAIVLALVAMGLTANTLGFQLVAFAFLLFLLLVLGRQNLAVTLVISIIGSFGLYYLFTNYLQVELPAATIEFLANLGL